MNQREARMVTVPEQGMIGLVTGANAPGRKACRDAIPGARGRVHLGMGR
ncbi:MAG: hypothetical protein J2P30_14025 [Actinobacteria bacterium]|nr:hypothetical protein [Actinomycetota bacterium]